MAQSFGNTVAQWVDDNVWPRKAEEANSILVINAGEVDGDFNFHSAFSYFEVVGTYTKDENSLTDLQVKLVVPAKSEATVLVTANSYALSTEEGEQLTFNLGDGYVTGTFSFKYQDYEEQQNIFVTYSANLPFAGEPEDSFTIAPTSLSEASGFSAAQLEALEPLEPFKAALTPTANDDPTSEQELLVKFLKDFVVDGDSIVVDAYYPDSQADVTDKSLLSNIRPNGASNQWEGTISFLGILELVGSVDPTTLTISAVLFAKIPIAGRVRLVGIKGSLLDGVTVKVNAFLVKGSATFTTQKNAQGKHELWVDASLTIKFIGKISTGGPKRIFIFPF